MWAQMMVLTHPCLRESQPSGLYFPKQSLVGFQWDVVIPGGSCQQLTAGISTQARSKTQIPPFHWFWRCKMAEGQHCSFWGEEFPETSPPALTFDIKQ